MHAQIWKTLAAKLSNAKLLLLLLIRLLWSVRCLRLFSVLLCSVSPLRLLSFGALFWTCKNEHPISVSRRETKAICMHRMDTRPLPQGAGQGHPATDTTKPKNKKAKKTHPDNAAKKGGAQPRPGPSTHAHTAHRNRKRRGASGARTKPHTYHKQAET